MGDNGNRQIGVKSLAQRNAEERRSRPTRAAAIRMSVPTDTQNPAAIIPNLADQHVR